MRCFPLLVVVGRDATCHPGPIQSRSMKSQVVRRKLIFVGDFYSGKISLIHSYKYGEMPQWDLGQSRSPYDPRIMRLRLDGQLLELALCSLPYQDDRADWRMSEYLDAHAILICFAISAPDGFRNAVDKWYKEICSAPRRPDVPIFLVGCKSDHRHSEYDQDMCLVSRHEAQIMASQMGARGYYECSALKSEGLDAVIDAAARASLEVQEDGGFICLTCGKWGMINEHGSDVTKPPVLSA